MCVYVCTVYVHYPLKIPRGEREREKLALSLSPARPKFIAPRERAEPSEYSATDTSFFLACAHTYIGIYTRIVAERGCIRRWRNGDFGIIERRAGLWIYEAVEVGGFEILESG